MVRKSAISSWAVIFVALGLLCGLIWFSMFGHASTQYKGLLATGLFGEDPRAAGDTKTQTLITTEEQAAGRLAKENELAAAEQEQERQVEAEKARIETVRHGQRAREEEARLEAEEAAGLVAEEKARHETEEAARLAEEEKDQQEAEEAVRLEAEEEASRLAAEEKARQEAEKAARLAAEEKARQEVEEAARLAAEEKARQEVEEAARLAAEEKARQEAEEAARLAAEEKARQEAEEAARLAAEEKARQEAEEAARLAAEEKARAAARQKADRIAAEKKALTPLPVLSMNLQSGLMELSGTLPSDKEVKALIKSIEKQFSSSDFTDTVSYVDQTREEPTWLTAIAGLVDQIDTSSSDLSLSINQGQVLIEGVVGTEEDLAALKKAVNEGFDDQDVVFGVITKNAEQPAGGVVDNYGANSEPTLLETIRAQELAQLPVLASNIQFQVESVEMDRDSQLALDGIFEILFLYPEITARMSVHVTDLADAASNQLLSDRRAEYIVKYLLDRGLDAVNVEARGTGAPKSNTPAASRVSLDAVER